MFKPILVRLRHWIAVSVAATLVVGGLVATATAAPAKNTGPLVFGAVGDVQSLDKAAGLTIARHTYGKFQTSVPTGEMITVNAQDMTWRQIAATAPGSTLHNHIVRWADTIKARGGAIQLAFGHEPEISSKKSLGTAEEFKSAYRKVVDIFNSRGVKNVQWVLQLTDWSFRTKTTEYNYAGKWYPGDAYVDIVGADAYNWHTCGEGLGRDVPLSTVAGGLVTFARERGKLASLPEFAANTSVKRDKWLRDGFAWMKSNRDVFVSAFYFNHPPTNPSNKDCSWPLATSAEKAAFAEIARDGWTASSAAPVTPPAASPPAAGTVMVGAGGELAALDKAAGKTVPAHVYASFDVEVPVGEMITVNTPDWTWKQVAATGAGSTLHNHIVRWADTIKARGGTVQIVYGQEPETSARKHLGTADEFKSAFRRVVDIFNSRGVKNVKWVFQASDSAFRVSTTAANHAGKWYPGDGYVDIVGAGSYNWHTCGGRQAQDTALSTAASGLVSFARAHGKLASLPEFAASKSVKRDRWLQDAHTWMKANRDVLTSAFYFNQAPANPTNANCGWPLRTDAEMAAFAAMVGTS